MFSDRFWVLKAAAALAAFSLLGHWATREYRRISPHPDMAALLTQPYEGKTVYLWSRTVLAHRSDGFDVSSNVGPFHVLSPARPPLGERVTARGTVAAPRTIVASAIQINDGYAWKRPANYFLSAAVVLLFVAAVGGRFRLRLHEGLFRSRY